MRVECVTEPKYCIWDILSAKFIIQTKTTDKILFILSTSIIFQPDKVLEFWYVLKFTVEFPDPIKLPEMQCDLGK